jgi:cyclopropane-fatty-acyl-phospholipid synthase
VTSTIAHPPWTIDPGRWPDVAVAAGSPGRVAVASALFAPAVARLPVRVRLPDGSLHGAGGPGTPVMHLHRPREFFRRLGAGGLIGFGESYMAGEWDSTDLTGLVTVFAAHAAELVPPGLQRLRRLAVRRRPPDDLQTIPGARRNIGRHYDLSNDLFALFLDETMTYSAALFAIGPDGVPAAGDLAEAQRRKIDRLLDRDRRQPGPNHAADHRARGLRRLLRRDAADLGGTVRRAGRRGRPPRLRRGVQPDVDLLPVLLRGRLPGRVHRRQPAHPGPGMSTAKGAAEVIAALLAQAGLDLPVRLRAWDGSEAGPVDGPVLVARSPRALQRILWRPGELGLARAYVSGDLDVEGDLTDGLRRVHATAPRSGPFGLIKTGPAAIAAAARLGLLAPPPEPPRCELRVRGRRHSRARDQAVIAGHYDVPSAFYQLILDPSMAYSCAYWDGVQDLATAQRAKLELIGRKLALAPGQTLLDMGCGWGSLTIHAASARVRVTGVTLSREQGGYVRRRARGLGLNPEVRIQDYRDPLDGPYDAIASVEMGEHVGAARYPAFCAALCGRLRPGGRLLIQQMSRTTRRGGGPFIESYIAPDMDMRPVGGRYG